MYLSTSDGINVVDIDDSSQIQQGNIPSVLSNTSQSSSPSCPTLLVIDDNSNSNDSSLNTTDIPANLILSNAQTTHVQKAPSPPLSTIDTSNDTLEQQRRRNSSIAKLLGGQPLKNQQYEEINQQILDDQSAQNVPNKNNGEIQRSRSSITRTLLMNAEQNKTTSVSTTNARLPSPGYSKDVEYLIRRELDIEHAPSTLQRDSSTPSVFLNLSSVRNSPSTTTPQSPSNLKLKRKRSHLKQAVPLVTINKSSNNAPFAIRDPFELDSSAPTLVPPIHRAHHQQQNGLFHFDNSHRHHHHHQQNQPPHPPFLPQPQQQYALPVNSTSFAYQKINVPIYAHFKNQHDRSSTTSSCSSSSCNCCRYPCTPELALPTPVSHSSMHASSPSILLHHAKGMTSRKTKAIHNRPDIYEIPMHRSLSGASNQSNASSSSSSSSSHSIPLKKRLLHAYKNEQRPSSSL